MVVTPQIYTCRKRRGTRVAHAVGQLALNFGSGQGLMDCGMEPLMGFCIQRGVCLKNFLPVSSPHLTLK